MIMSALLPHIMVVEGLELPGVALIGTARR